MTRGGTQVSHLMFADDVVLFGEASKEQAQVINDCLSEFCVISGRKLALTNPVFIFRPTLMR